jgi:hypothetical protein
MARARLALLLAGAMIGTAVGAAAWGQAQQKSDAIDPVLSGSPPAKLKREETPSPPDKPATAASIAAAPEAPDEDNADVESAAPSSHAAAVKPMEPMKRPRYAVAVLQALDKVTAETVRFEAPVNQPVRYKTLIFTVRACETTAPDETDSDAIAHVEIDNQPNAPTGMAQPAARQVFKGWMFASSPGLNLLQHPIYDAWLIACKTSTPAA